MEARSKSIPAFSVYRSNWLEAPYVSKSTFDTPLLISYPPDVVQLYHYCILAHISRKQSLLMFHICWFGFC